MIIHIHIFEVQSYHNLNNNSHDSFSQTYSGMAAAVSEWSRWNLSMNRGDDEACHLSWARQRARGFRCLGSAQVRVVHVPRQDPLSVQIVLRRLAPLLLLAASDGATLSFRFA